MVVPFTSMAVCRLPAGDSTIQFSFIPSGLSSVVQEINKNKARINHKEDGNI
jgi:hypothetical protein